MSITAAAEPHAGAGPGCSNCTVHQAASLRRLGVDAAGADFVVALAGNPNTGKSTLFNALTGLRQHVGNWSGKTVTRAEGGFTFRNRTFKLVDLPGTHTLLASSVEEEIARDMVLFGRPDVVVVVADATNLARSLPLTLQVLEITSAVVVGLNLMDESRRRGLALDTRHLARELGVPVVPLSARRGEGIAELLGAVADVASGVTVGRMRHSTVHDPAVEAAVARLAAVVEEAFPGVPNARWVAMRLLDGDPSVEAAVRDGTLGQVAAPEAERPVALELRGITR
jgi:ferrous iron transport protein B